MSEWSIDTGKYIESTALLKGTFFENTRIIITEYNQEGAMGFVFNKLFPRKFNELAEFADCPPFPLYDGGPVDREHLYFIHRRPDLIEGGIKISSGIYYGGDFATAVACMKNGDLREDDIKLFIGYCGWNWKEIDGELAEGSWKPLEGVNLLQVVL